MRLGSVWRWAILKRLGFTPARVPGVSTLGIVISSIRTTRQLCMPAIWILPPIPARCRTFFNAIAGVILHS